LPAFLEFPCHKTDNRIDADMKIAMVMHDDTFVRLKGAETVKDARSRWPGGESSAEHEVDGNTLSFEIDGGVITIGHMPAVIPDSELDGPCQTSLLWPRAADEVKRHRSHSIVTISDAPDLITASKRLTSAVVSFMAVHESAIGVYWCDSVAVHSKAVFTELATELLPDHLPAILWVDCRVNPAENGRATGFTHGMKSLGHKEIEATDAHENAKELYDRLTGLVDYLLENGPVINDGDTLGESETERIRCIVGESKAGHPDPVMKLVYGQPEINISLTSFAVVSLVITLAIWLLNGRKLIVAGIVGVPLLCLLLVALLAKQLKKNAEP